MEAKKIVAVFGATGTQGGSVVKALLKGSPSFHVRAVTRNPESEASGALRNLGVEVVKGDQDDPTSLEAVFEGAYATFLVTNYWAHFDKAREIQQGINCIEVAKKKGVQHIVFSSLEDTSEKFKVIEHFDTKVAIERHLKQSGVPYTVIQFAMYMENLFTFFRPEKVADNTYALTMPLGNARVLYMAASECGPCIRIILEKKEQYVGKVIGLSSDFLTLEEMASILSSKLSPLKFVPGTVTLEEYATKAPTQCLVDMFELYQKGLHANPASDVKNTRLLNPGISDFKTFVDLNLENFRKAFG